MIPTVTLREAQVLVRLNSPSIRRHYYLGHLPGTTLVKNKLMFVYDELMALPGVAKIVQPEVPAVGPRLLPSPAPRRLRAPSSICRPRLPWRWRAVVALVLFSTVATWYRLAFYPVPDYAQWPISHHLRLMIVIQTLVLDLMAAIGAATLTREDLIVVAKHSGLYWIFVAIRYIARRISAPSSQLRRGRGDRQQSRPPRVRWSVRELQERAA